MIQAQGQDSLLCWYTTLRQTPSSTLSLPVLPLTLLLSHRQNVSDSVLLVLETVLETRPTKCKFSYTETDQQHHIPPQTKIKQRIANESIQLHLRRDDRKYPRHSNSYRPRNSLHPHSPRIPLDPDHSHRAHVSGRSHLCHNWQSTNDFYWRIPRSCYAPGSSPRPMEQWYADPRYG